MGKGEQGTTQLAGPQGSADDDPRWRQPEKLTWSLSHNREWARRPGASPPMRMAASWSDPLGDLPHTSLPRDPSRLAQGELASGYLSSAFDPRWKRRLTRPGKACRRARDRQGQVASRWGRMAGDDCQSCSWFVSSSPRSAIGDHLLVPTWVSRWPPRAVTVKDGEGELIIVR